MRRAGVKHTNLKITNFFPKTKKPISKSVYYIKWKEMAISIPPGLN